LIENGRDLPVRRGRLFQKARGFCVRKGWPLSEKRAAGWEVKTRGIPRWPIAPNRARATSALESERDGLLSQNGKGPIIEKRALA